MYVPEPSKKRLVQLSRLLQELKANSLTSTRLQELTGWTSATIRKDLSYILNAEKMPQHKNLRQPKAGIQSVRGKSNGYGRTELIEAIQSALFPSAQSISEKCCIIGLGAFGQALMESPLPEHSRFVIAAGFDSSLNRVETLNAPFPLYPLTQLERVVAAENIGYAILSADEKNIRDTAARLVACGIKGIVNYSPVILPAAKQTKVENLSLSISLQNLAC
ncbi:hypothetical protein H0R92_12580 [Treponema sp. OMZ 840]|uniref:winged-helix domain-containing protein n=1 Tax=Treponema sp. OMZ 840 TaxID=244313 RepID=UPI003D94A570